MSAKSAGRIAVAVFVGYLLNVFLIVATDSVFVQLMRPVGSTPPRSYFVADVISQCIIQMLAGFVCRWIAGGRAVALVALIAIGVVIGAISLRYSWNAEPHWYGIILLAIYVPCIWAGWVARSWGERRMA